MKKIQLLVILVLSIFLVISCSHNDEEEELDNSGDNTSQDGENSGDTLPETIGNDDDKNDTASESGDSDNADTSDNDNPTDNSDDTVISDADTPDNDDDPADDPNDSDDIVVSDDDISENDSDDYDDSDNIVISDIDTSENDNDDSTVPDTDSGDSQPDDDADADTSEPAFPECSPTSTKPCISGKLIWSETKKTKRTQGGCNTSCNELNEGGYSSGWRLPTINELRTLVQNCDKTVSLPDGLCKVSDTCNTTDCKEKNCKCSSGTDYSKLGDTDSLWSSTMNNNGAWYINFNNAEIDSTLTSERKSARCVHEIK